jgi:hypothetical protein
MQPTKLQIGLFGKQINRLSASKTQVSGFGKLWVPGVLGKPVFTRYM